MKLVGTLALVLAALLWIHTTGTMEFPGHLHPRATPLSVGLTGVAAIAYMWWHLFGRPVQRADSGARQEQEIA